ncbi:hypothetical protein G6038_12230 [Rhodococcus sp. 14C212]|uniref:Rv2732c family membrane protein n=1 Tax=Rhodococcus sp. 14C212 TaxID=2711209 RepID=UPI0013EDBC12|nr:hypothetical protein [Rhodococcus sp. 14C212]NGP06235.1 hypothetical protein [Rhodococcus sp. 14C212]
MTASGPDESRTPGDDAGDDGRDPMDEVRADLEAAERKIAGEIDPGARALVVAVAVLVLLGSFSLPHAGAANGWEVLSFAPDATAESIALPSRIFVWLALVFGGIFSILALVTRRWVLAWLALAGSAVSIVFGMLSIWSRQTLPVGDPGAGPGIGLILGWITVMVLTFHWAKVVWTRTALQLAAEEELRNAAAQQENKGLLDD